MQGCPSFFCSIDRMVNLAKFSAYPRLLDPLPKVTKQLHRYHKRLGENSSPKWKFFGYNDPCPTLPGDFNKTCKATLITSMDKKGEVSCHSLRHPGKNLPVSKFSPVTPIIARTGPESKPYSDTFRDA